MKYLTGNDENLTLTFAREFVDYANMDMQNYSKLLMHAGVADALADKDMDRAKLLVDEFKRGADYEA
jgi:hypothetical protein